MSPQDLEYLGHAPTKTWSILTSPSYSLGYICGKVYCQVYISSTVCWGKSRQDLEHLGHAPTRAWSILTLRSYSLWHAPTRAWTVWVLQLCFYLLKFGSFFLRPWAIVTSCVVLQCWWRCLADILTTLVWMGVSRWQCIKHIFGQEKGRPVICARYVSTFSTKKS